MKKKELEKKIKDLNETIFILLKQINCTLSIEEARKRDYIVRTKGLGKMKDKKLIADFQKEFPDYNNIQNYEFSNLDKYYDTLKLYEQKQIVIDVYGTKA